MLQAMHQKFAQLQVLYPLERTHRIYNSALQKYKSTKKRFYKAQKFMIKSCLKYRIMSDVGHNTTVLEK